MSVLSFDIRGIPDLQRRLQQAPKALLQEVEREIKDSADRIARNAQRDAPVDEGGIRRGISVQKVTNTSYNVVSAADYSAFMEWGTKTRVRVPADLANYAAQFKGIKGGTKAQALKALIGWVRRKGIRIDSKKAFKSGKRKGQLKKLSVEQTAKVILYFILKNGVKPQPFFFKNFEAEKPIFVQHVRKVLTTI